MPPLTGQRLPEATGSRRASHLLPPASCTRTAFGRRVSEGSSRAAPANRGLPSEPLGIRQAPDPGYLQERISSLSRKLQQETRSLGLVFPSCGFRSCGCLEGSQGQSAPRSGFGAAPGEGERSPCAGLGGRWERREPRERRADPSGGKHATNVTVDRPPWCAEPRREGHRGATVLGWFPH